MIKTIDDAKTAFESAGLFTGGRSLFMVSEEPAVEAGGVRAFHKPCYFLKRADTWSGSFPSDDPRTFEVSGVLDDLVSLALRIYELRSARGASYGEAFRELVEDADAYLVGDGVPRVKPTELRLTSPAAPTG